RILRHHPESEQGWFYRWSEWVFVKTIEQYGKALRVVLRYQMVTLLVAVGTLVATVYLFMIVPKGFFPIHDTGVRHATSKASQTVSSSATAERQQHPTQAILKD